MNSLTIKTERREVVFFFLGEKCFPVGKWVLSVVSVNLF